MGGVSETFYPLITDGTVMRVYLNDWSLSSSNGVVANEARIRAFGELLQELSAKCSLEIYAPDNLWQIPLAGCDVISGIATHPNDKDISREMVIYLRFLYHKMIGTVSGYPMFSEREDMVNPSSSVGHAAYESRPVISLALDGMYADDSLNGWLQMKGGAVASKGCVTNIYERKIENFYVLPDLTACADKDPLQEPLWNTGMVRELLSGVELVKAENKVRQSLLVKYGRMVAEMNGWVYDTSITKLNQNPGQLRYIFSSDTHFTRYKKAYLSLDMEGPDLAFELCDKKGKHQGQVSWNGAHKAAKEKHDIVVK